MNHNLLIQLFYHGTMAVIIGFAFFRYLIDYLKTESSIKLKEEVLKISFVIFLNYSLLTLRILFENYNIRSMIICYLFVLEVFMNLFVFFTLLKLFYYIRTSKIPGSDCKKKPLLIILSDFFVWVMLSLLIFFSLLNGQTSIEFILNLRIYYLLPYSLTIFAVFIVIPTDIKSFRELKAGFFFLSLAFFAEFIAKYLGYFEEKLVYEIIFSVKFFSLITLVYNFYVMTLTLPDRTKGCVDKE